MFLIDYCGLKGWVIFFLYNAYFIEYFVLFFWQICTYSVSLDKFLLVWRPMKRDRFTVWLRNCATSYSTISAKWKVDMTSNLTQPWTDINDLILILAFFFDFDCFRNEHL